MIFRSKDHFIRHFGSLKPTILDTGFTPLGLMFRGGDWRRTGGTGGFGDEPPSEGFIIRGVDWDRHVR